MKRLLCVVLFSLAFVGCGEDTGSVVSKEVRSEAYHADAYERLGFPVKMHDVVERSGMRYVVFSGTFGESGVHVINLTLDSLQVAYYQRELCVEGCDVYELKYN